MNGILCAALFTLRSISYLQLNYLSPFTPRPPYLAVPVSPTPRIADGNSFLFPAKSSARDVASMKSYKIRNVPHLAQVFPSKIIKLKTYRLWDHLMPLQFCRFATGGKELKHKSNLASY